MTTQLFTTWPAKANLTETFTELTAVGISYDGTESRTPCRAGPRYGLSANYIFFPDELAELQKLELGQRLLVPAWMHKFDTDLKVYGSPLASAVTSEGLARKFLVHTASGSYVPLTADCIDNNTSDYPAINYAAWAGVAGAVSAYPLVDAELSEDSFSIEAVGVGYRQVSLSFQSDSVDEPLRAWTGATSQGLPLLAERADWKAATPQVQPSLSTNRFDNGNTTTLNLRHVKRATSVAFTLLGREAVLEFRQFIRGLRGRAKPFRWVAFDGIERTYRLAADTWSLEWTGCAMATCKLQFVEVQA